MKKKTEEYLAAFLISLAPIIVYALYFFFGNVNSQVWDIFRNWRK